MTWVALQLAVIHFHQVKRIVNNTIFQKNLRFSAAGNHSQDQGRVANVQIHAFSFIALEGVTPGNLHTC